MKLAPDLADADLPEVVGVILAHGVDGIIVSNTTLSREASTRSLSAARAEVSRAARCSPGRRGCWRGSTGLRRQAAADRRRRHQFRRGGAGQDRGRRTLLQLYTGLVFAGPGLISASSTRMVEAMGKTRDTLKLMPLMRRRARGWIGGQNRYQRHHLSTIRAARSPARRWP